jgi:hypothetical protein
MTKLNTLRLTFEAVDGAVDADFTVDDLVIGGWTGRDRVKLEEHMVELEAVGVARPASTPCFYRGGANLVTTADSIQVVGEDTSGEVECFLLKRDDGFWVGLGSDHTDRKTEAYSITISKQCCPKVVASTVWRYADLEDHWDELLLRSWHVEGGERTLYQEGAVSAMIDPMQLAAGYAENYQPLKSGQVMFGGTLPAIGAIRGAGEFAFEIEDPVLKRKLTHSYTVTMLPNIG